MFNIVSAWGARTNPHYNPDTANNGGGYWQYAGVIVADIGGQLCTVEVDAVLASISGVLGVDAEALISAALDAANICAWEVCYAD